MDDDISSWVIDHITGLARSHLIPERLKTLASGMLKKINLPQVSTETPVGRMTALKDQLSQSREWLNAFIGKRSSENSTDTSLNIFEILSSASNIQQYQKNRLMLLYDPPDVLIAPEVTDVGSLEFTRGAETIEEGRSKTQKTIPTIRRLIREKQKAIQQAGGSPS
jgi:predicted acylesterase/phospholipase RssA